MNTTNYLSYVNVKQGSRNNFRFSNGNAFPFTQLPFAMHGFTIQTTNEAGWFYSPDHRTTEGIRLTHQPSPWVGDYTPLIFMPQRGVFYQKHGAKRHSFFRQDKEVFTPANLEVFFERYQAGMKVVPTERGAAMKLQFEGDAPTAFCVFTKPGEAEFSIDAKKRLLTGYTTYHAWPVHESFKMYFALEFSCDIIDENSVINIDHESSPGAYVALTEKNVDIRLAVSYISVEQALVTMERETKASYGELLESAQQIWESYLSKIELTGEQSEKQLKTFYSCFYRTFLYPHKFHEIDKEGNTIHFCADTGKVCPGVKYVDNGFWDTFRTEHPFLTIFAPDEECEIVEGFVNTYKDCGWLPKWPAPAEVGMMPGTLFEAVIADAAVKGMLDGPVLEDALAGMLKEAVQEAAPPYGRRGTEDFKKYGYIPRDVHKESVSHTLDYVYGDFCIAQTLRVAGRGEEAAEFDASALNYKKLFDADTGFMRGRDREGKFADNFDPLRWGGEYCEGGPWQSSFAVYHDYEGLADLYGGREGLLARLDMLFNTPPYYSTDGYDREIHEMGEMAANDFGQCAIGNQPSFHIPWMYAEMDAPEKTSYWLEKITREAFSWEVDGFPGDDDNGTMSAWYIFAQLGFYPTCPGKDTYIAVPALVDAVLHLKDKDIVIRKGEERPKYLPHSYFTK